MEIKVVTVIGANGTMGYNASAIFASFGNAKVYMVSRDIQKSRNAIDKAVRAVKSDSIRKNLIPCDYSSLPECVENSDLIFESVSEDLKTKSNIIKEIGLYATDNAIIATGTSGLSINEISKVIVESKRKNFYGIHFFNPPYSMTLIELIPSKYAKKTEELRIYLETVLLRTVIVCKDSPAFVANRVGFQFLNMALQYAEKYKEDGGIDYIDSIFGGYTGRAMTPCATVDFVGLDVHKAIVENLFQNMNDYEKNSFELPKFVEKLISEGRLGRKTFCGLFKTEIAENGVKTRLVYDVKTGKYLPAKQYSFPFADEMNNCIRNGDYEEAFTVLNRDQSKEALICKDFLKTYIDYSIFVAKEVCSDMHMADDAMAMGFNWCPPLALSNVLNKTTYSTKYDYRRFFKAVR